MRRTCLALPLVLACSEPPAPDTTFPRDFLFGVATAGFQHDPGCPTHSEGCEDHASDWWQWMTDPHITADARAYIAPGSPSQGPGWHELFPQDFARVRSDLNLDAVRLSIEWSRVFPSRPAGTDDAALAAAASVAGIDYYHRQFAAMRALGLKPLVTVNHYTLPLWIHDGAACHADLETCTARGWLDPATVDEIARYAGFVAREFGGEVDLWATLNEPFAVVVPGYVAPAPNRSNPPGLFFHGAEARTVLLALAQAHARMYDAIHAGDTRDADGDGTAAAVGFAADLLDFVPKDPSSDDDVQAAANARHLYDEVFVDAVTRGDFDPLLDGHPQHRDDLAGRADWVGINYYKRATISSAGSPFLQSFSPLTTFNPLDLLAAEAPGGIRDIVLFAHRRWGLPIVITENGLPTTLRDDGRSWDEQTRSLVQHLVQLRAAIAEGAVVRGYFYWSIVDNIEWNMGMDGMCTGLYAVDKDDPAKARTPRPAGAAMARIARARAVPPELAGRYPGP